MTTTQNWDARDISYEMYWGQWVPASKSDSTNFKSYLCLLMCVFRNYAHPWASIFSSVKWEHPLSHKASGTQSGPVEKEQQISGSFNSNNNGNIFQSPLVSFLKPKIFQ